MGEADPEQGRKNEGVISNDAAKARGENCAATELFETVYGTKVEDCNDNGEISALELRDFKHVDQFFHTFDCSCVSIGSR